MLKNYTQKHNQIVKKIAALKSLFENSEQWWQQSDALSSARAEFSHFIRNMENNFGDDARGYLQIQSAEHRAQRHQQIVSAILSYRDDRTLWQSILAANGSTQHTAVVNEA